jgi:hypothetical protein
MADLVAATGVAVGASASVGAQVVFLDRLDFVSRTGAAGYRRERRRRGHRNRLPCTECGTLLSLWPIWDVSRWCFGSALDNRRRVRAYRRGPLVGHVDRRLPRLPAPESPDRLHVPTTQEATILGESSTQWRMGRRWRRCVSSVTRHDRILWTSAGN